MAWLQISCKKHFFTQTNSLVDEEELAIVDEEELAK